MLRRNSPSPAVTDALSIPETDVCALMAGRTWGGIDTAFCASYAASWRDIPPFDQSKGTHRPSIGS